MKKLSLFLSAILISAMSFAGDVTETITMKKFGGLSTNGYENVTKTGTSDKGTEMVAYAFNPTNGQVRGNKTAIAGASVTSADKNKNWSLYNTQPMAGAIKSIKVTQTATGTNKFQNSLYVALGTTNQGSVTTVTGAQKHTTCTATEFTFDIDETKGYTYFKLMSNTKFTANSVAGVVVTVTYAEVNTNPDAPKYTITANVNDPAMGTVVGAGEYEEGKVATLTANANPGYKFVNWSNGSTDNPLKLTVTEDIELTANFEAVPPMTCAEASAATNGATIVLNPFDVVYVVKGAGYIYIKDESGAALIYDYTLDDQLKAGDHVQGFVGTLDIFNTLPEIKASVSYNDLTVTPGTAPEPTLFTEVPTKADLNKYVKFENVTLTANATFTTSSATNATMVVNGKNVTLRNNFKLAATLSKDKAYNIVGFAAIYNSTIQVYFLSAEEYVAPEPCTLATPVNWDAPIAAEANTDQWYAVNVASAIAAGKDLALTVTNPGTEAVEITIEAYADCPATELIVKSTKTFNAGETKTTTVKYDEYLADQVEVVYLHVVTSGDLTIGTEAIEPCSKATAINWDDAINAEANTDKWYAVNLASAIAAGKDIELTIANPGTEAVEITAEAYANCPATEKIAGATSTIAAGATKTTTIKFDEFLADQVDVVYLHVITKGGEIKVEAETVKFNVTATAENGTVEGAGVYEQGAEATLTATAAEGYEFVNWTVAGEEVSTENPYKFTVTADVALVANFKKAAPAMETVYFINNKSWSKVNTYAWEPVQNAGWPGKAATKEAEKVAGYDVYSYTAEVGKHKNVIFNNGSSQTNDLKWTAGKYYWMGNAKNFAGATKEEAEAALAKPVEYESVYFVNAQGWAKVNIYTWSPEVGTWPGVAMKKEAEQLAGFNVYSYTVEKGTSFGGMLFNNGSGTQTGDLQWTAGKYYVKDGWYTKEEAEAKLAGPVVTVWTMVGDKALFGTDWDLNATANDLVKQEDGSWVLTLTNKTLAAKSYEYKAAKDRSWTTTVPGGNNAKLTISKAGQYDVTFTLNAAATSVTAKATYIPAKYNVTVTAENGTVEGAGEYEEGATATLTATPAEGYEFINWLVDNVEVSDENPYTFTVTADVALVANFDLIPVVEPEKPEPTYTENNLNPYAFGLESELTEDGAVLNVVYRLNNSNATSVNVIVYNGEEVVATVPGTTTIGKNTVEVPTADLPGGVELTWSVEVNGTSVAAPTREEKIYSFFHPSSVDVDNNPENPTFGMLLVNEAMQSVASTTGYLSSGFGAGIFAFTPSFDPIMNGEKPGFNGGKTFSTVKNDFAPRRIRISKDGRIFATAQDGSGEYLWEINPENLDEWTTVFQGTNDGYTLKDAEGNFIAGTNSGFDVRGEGENLQLLMLSASLPGAQVGSFKCHTYDLGTATTWATAPTKEIPGANYMLVTNQSNAQFDKDGGVWYISYRGTTTEKEPGLVHINKDGVEDYKELRHMTRNAGFRFNHDFTKVIIAGNNGASKKATIYAISEDANGAPVLTQETVIDMSAVGANLNDFAWDYAGNLYACGNSSEKLAAWAMPYSGQVETPAAAKYAFQVESAPEYYEDVITNMQFDLENMVIIGGPSENFQIDVFLVLGEDDGSGEFQLTEESSVAVMGSDAKFIDGIAYEIDAYAPAALVDLVVEWNGNLYQFHLTMSAAPMEATKVVVENAAVEIEKYLLFGDTYDYSLKMTGNWINEADGLTYPVLVEVPVYYPEATEPSTILSTVTVGGWGDEDPWLGFGEGELTVTTVGNTVTATGIVENPMAGIAIDITISGNLTTTGLENATVIIKSIKKIENGQLIIEKDGVQYNAQGAILK